MKWPLPHVFPPISTIFCHSFLTIFSQEALAYAQENGLAYFETSARKGTNIADMFLSIARTYAETVAAKSAGREPDVRRNKYAILEGTVESVDAAEPQAKSKCCT